jgi:acyl-CoA dehydrogenase
MTDSLLTDTVGEIFAAVCTDDALRAAERDGFAPRAWAAVAEAGLPWISVSEAAGGEGGDLADALAVLRLAGYHGLPLPLAETGVLAGWLLAASGLRADRVPTTVTSGPGLAWSGETVTGSARLVPWARSASQVAVLVPAGTAGPAEAGDAVVAVFSLADLRVEHHVNLAGEPRDTVYFDGTAPLARADQDRLDGGGGQPDPRHHRAVHRRALPVRQAHWPVPRRAAARGPRRPAGGHARDGR